MEWTAIAALVGGLVALSLGADWLVRGGAKLALTLGIPPLVVGLTIIAFGTSAPEFSVSVGAALKGSADVALGNVLGSITANVLLALGLAAIIRAIPIHSQIVRQEMPIYLAAMVLFAAMLLDGQLSRLDGIILFSLIIAYVVFLIRQSRLAGKEETEEFLDEIPKSRWDDRPAVQIALIIAGLIALIQGADWAVEGAVQLARGLGISELVIGVTVIAVGTSLPEIVTTVVAMIKKEGDIAVGNIVGSNIFNIFAVMGAAAAVAPEGVAVAPEVLRVDLWVAAGCTLALLPVILTDGQMQRWEGGLFLACYALYIAHLALQQSGAAAHAVFAEVVTGVVIPLVIAALLLHYVWHQAKRG